MLFEMMTHEGDPKWQAVIEKEVTFPPDNYTIYDYELQSVTYSTRLAHTFHRRTGGSVFVLPHSVTKYNLCYETYEFASYNARQSLICLMHL